MVQEQGGIRPYHQAVNQSIQQTDSKRSLPKRLPSDRSCSDMSSFTVTTMDSVNLRKAQIIADPCLDDDDMTYRDGDSYADHDTVTMASTCDYGELCEYLPEGAQHHVPYDGASTVTGTTFFTTDSVQVHNRRGSRSIPREVRESVLQDQEPQDTPIDSQSVSTIATGDLVFEEDGSEIDDNSFFEDYSVRDTFDELEEDDDEEVDPVEEIDEDLLDE